MLDLSALEMSLVQCEKICARLDAPETKSDAELGQFLRTAAVKSYEFAYAVAYRLMRRYLDMTGAGDEDALPLPSESLSFRQILDRAAKRGIVRDVGAWLSFREKRNVTSHAYHPETAEAICKILPVFIAESRFLLAAMLEQTKKAGISP